MVILKRNRFVASNQVVVPIVQGKLCGEEEALKPDSGLFPRTNLYEEEDLWLFTFEIPGVDPSDLEIRLAGSRLVVQGKRASYHRNHRSRIHCREGCIGACAFARSVEVPEEAEPQSLRVRVANGMLFISMRKRSADGAENGAPPSEGAL